LSSLRLAVLGSLGLLLVGCIDLQPGSLVTRTRVVGARVSPDRDPSLAWPSAGDPITVDWLVVAPGAPDAIAATLVACRPLSGSGGLSCAPGTSVPLPARAPSTEPFLTTLTLPDAETIGTSRSWLVFGALCFGGSVPGELAAVPIETRCTGDEGEHAASIVALDVPLEIPPLPTNHHPTIADEAWTLDGAAWEEPPVELPSEGCAAIAGVPAVTAEDPPRAIELTLTWSDDDREPYQTIGGDPPGIVDAREELEVAYYTTAGALARSRVVVDDEDEAGGVIENDWTPPPVADVPEAGLLVRFTAFARDDRSGVERADRVLCVMR
jgi:hypothetical protein